jgi:uncharacterized protein (UPF0264 family)
LKVLISIKDAVEAGEITGLKGVDLVDVKNPAEGTLGANQGAPLSRHMVPHR